MDKEDDMILSRVETEFTNFGSIHIRHEDLLGYYVVIPLDLDTIPLDPNCRHDSGNIYITSDSGIMTPSINIPIDKLSIWQVAINELFEVATQFVNVIRDNSDAEPFKIIHYNNQPILILESANKEDPNYIDYTYIKKG